MRRLVLTFLALAVVVQACISSAGVAVSPVAEYPCRGQNEGQSLWLSAQACATAETAWTAGWMFRTEQVLCVPAGAWDTATVGGVYVAKVRAFEPARWYFSDSLHVYVLTFGLCGDSLPSLHTHIVDNGVRYAPSQVDSETASARHAPFSILMSARDLMLLYGRR